MGNKKTRREWSGMRTLAITAALATALTSTAWSQQQPPAQDERTIGGARADNGNPGVAGQPAGQPSGPTAPHQGGPPASRPQTAAGGNKSAGGNAPRGAQAPFQLSQREYEELFVVLKAWERDTAQIKTMKCTLTVFEYRAAFVADAQPGKPQVLQGEMQFEAPDKGLYRVKDAAGKDWTEYWMCDGKSVYEYNAPKRQLIERTLPPELRGKRIVDGPMPFLFGADANRLLNRYFMRIIPTPPKAPQDQIWIEAWPRFQADAANYHHVTVILVVDKDKKLLPFAVETFATNGKDRTVHRLDNVEINKSKWRLFDTNEFIPKLPSGWTRVVNPEAQSTQAPQNPRKTAAQPTALGVPRR